jgi:hypothetical protein
LFTTNTTTVNATSARQIRQFQSAQVNNCYRTAVKTPKPNTTLPSLTFNHHQLTAKANAIFFTNYVRSMVQNTNTTSHSPLHHRAQ